MNRHLRISWTASLVGALLVSGLLTQTVAATKTGKEPPMIAICTDCKDETIGFISREHLAFIDFASFFAAINIIPAWISGKAELPVGKKPSCAELGLRFYEGVHGANRYRLYHSRLKTGSDLILGDLSGAAKTYSPGAKEHRRTQEELYRLMNRGFATGQELLEAYEQQSCYAIEGVAEGVAK